MQGLRLGCQRCLCRPQSPGVPAPGPSGVQAEEPVLPAQSPKPRPARVSALRVQGFGLSCQHRQPTRRCSPCRRAESPCGAQRMYALSRLCSPDCLCASRCCRTSPPRHRLSARSLRVSTHLPGRPQRTRCMPAAATCRWSSAQALTTRVLTRVDFGRGLPVGALADALPLHSAPAVVLLRARPRRRVALRQLPGLVKARGALRRVGLQGEGQGRAAIRLDAQPHACRQAPKVIIQTSRASAPSLGAAAGGPGC